MYRRGRGIALELGRLKSGPPAVFQHVPRNLLEGMEDVQGGVVRAGAPGLHGGGDEHARGGACVRAAPGHGAEDAEALSASGVPSAVAAATGRSWTRTAG